ncbi:MAG: amidohydrolase family protein [Candidatus Aminicenantes bacterium]|nr:amidohydrolase family protein [Candidatus Aminicenantes bacterium]
MEHSKAAELILTNGQFWTLDPACPFAQAVAVHTGRILRVGSWDQVKSLKAKSTHLIDLKGSFVVPGFIDCHTHFLDGGLSLSSLNLREAESKTEFISLIQQKAEVMDQGAWITDGQWDHHQFVSPQLPEKEWIDKVTPENPVCIQRKDLHAVFANSLALHIAGITKHTPDPKGGEILRNLKTGEPTGVLMDSAADLVLKHIPEPSQKEKLKAAEKAIRLAHKKGVTSVHEMGPINHLEIYKKLHEQNKGDLRISLYPPLSLIDEWPEAEIKRKKKNQCCQIRGLKSFVDGSLGSSTALFFDQYADDTGNKGILASDMFPKGKMEERIQKAEKAGFQLCVHAIGDRANHIILDIFEKVMQRNQKRDRRWRVEHAQHLIPEDIVRMGQMGIIASVQPAHLIDDGQWAEKRIGSSRIRYSFALSSLLDNGVRLAMGSDWTVAPLDPLLGIFAAVTRETLDRKHPGGWIPMEKISVQQAVRACTLDAAAAEFTETMKGSIEAGKVADMAVMDQNLFEIDPSEIKDVQVLMTVFNGRVVYQK